MHPTPRRACGLSNSTPSDSPRMGTRRVRLICTLYSSALAKLSLSDKQVPPPLCRACRPTPRRHFASHNSSGACVKDKAGGAPACPFVNCAASATSRPITWSARSARPRTGCVALDWRHGVGRLRRTTRTLRVPWAGITNASNSPHWCSGLLNTSDPPPSVRVSDKAGAGRARDPNPKHDSKPVGPNI